ncbi:hypothetical protein OUZ56_033859 [Daphnia magna]|uniref:Secreted protein n=1 Tax=Daphnia magna TaxID=35525 RepID=A0ABQ9ZYB5_9CRUS|nr:hypothetical protein OUZ56_033859 [Daphnia magna]
MILLPNGYRLLLLLGFVIPVLYFSSLFLHYSASCENFGSRFTTSCQLRLMVPLPDSCRTLPAHGSCLRFLPNTSTHGPLLRFLPTTSAHGFHLSRSLNVPVCTTLTLFTVFPRRLSFVILPLIDLWLGRDPVPQQFKVLRPVGHRLSRGSLTATASAAQESNRNTTTKKSLPEDHLHHVTVCCDGSQD